MRHQTRELTQHLTDELERLSDCMQEALVLNDVDSYHQCLTQSNVVFECINKLEEAYK